MADSRRAAVGAAIEKRMMLPTTTTRERRHHLRKFEDVAANICSRLREHVKTFPGSPV